MKSGTRDGKVAALTPVRKTSVIGSMDDLKRKAEDFPQLLSNDEADVARRFGLLPGSSRIGMASIRKAAMGRPAESFGTDGDRWIGRPWVAELPRQRLSIIPGTNIGVFSADPLGGPMYYEEYDTEQQGMSDPIFDD